MVHVHGASRPLFLEALVGQLQVQLVQTQLEPQFAIEQIRILTLKVNSNASAAAAAATTTALATTTAGSQSKMPKVNYQFGKYIIPNIFDGKQRNDFPEWTENSALYLSAKCVDACEILLEWLVSEKEHVTDTAIQTRCDEDDLEYDNVNTFSRVTFVYLSLRTTETARKIVTNGKRGDGLDAWRRVCQEYNPQLVTGAQAVVKGTRKNKLSHVKQNTTTGTNKNPSQQWNVSVKWDQPPIKGNKKKVQVRNRFQALQTDVEEILTNDETVDPIWPEAITMKQDQNRRNQTHKRRVVSSKLNTRGNGKETSLCPLGRGKMIGNTEGEEWKLMPRPLVIDSGAAETVIPTDWFTGHELTETEESREGQFLCLCRTKGNLHYGERKLMLSTLDWSSIRNMTFQVTEVT